MFCCSSREDNKKASSGTVHRPMEMGGGAPSDSTMPQGAPPGASGKPVGVGIVFQPDSTGALHVKSLAVGGPADKSGSVQVGDVLHEIDSHHVYRKPVAQLAPLILGQEGTAVRLGLQRGNLQRLVYVELRRGWSLQPGQAQPGGAPSAAPGKAWSHPLPQGAKMSHFPGAAPQQ